MSPSYDEYCNCKVLADKFENQVLYKMCRKSPRHECAYVNAGKLISIGRIYAASPQRGAGKAKQEKPEFFEALGEALKECELDDMLKVIPFDARISNDEVSLKLVLDTHEYFECTLRSAIKKWRIVSESKPRRQILFASKYLHFHRPNAFPIVDSIVKLGLRKEGVKGAFLSYKEFCTKFVGYAEKHGQDWTPRGVDTVLLSKGRRVIWDARGE
jgi:hypothetical protein